MIELVASITALIAAIIALVLDVRIIELMREPHEKIHELHRHHLGHHEMEGPVVHRVLDRQRQIVNTYHDYYDNGVLVRRILVKSDPREKVVSERVD